MFSSILSKSISSPLNAPSFGIVINGVLISSITPLFTKSISIKGSASKNIGIPMMIICLNFILLVYSINISVNNKNIGTIIYDSA